MHFRTLLAVATLAAAATAQFNLTTPNGYATAEGNSNNAFPWNRGTASMLYQQIMDSTDFTGQGVTSPILISRMKFRANGTTATWAGGTWPNVIVRVATSANDYLSASSTFASNLGPDVTTIHSGPVSVIGGTGNGTTVPGPVTVDIPFSAPFVYDPTTGNDFIFEVNLDGTGWSGASTQADAVSGAAASPAPANGTRIYSTASNTATTGTVGANYTIVCELTYVPAAGLWPAFSATPTSGPTGQIVQFTDQSYSSDPGGVLAWIWDLDGDNVADSSLQHPTFTYNTEGFYNVSLTAVDATHGLVTLTRPNYISIGAVDASFTFSIVSGTIVQFTDTSAGNPTSWAWDFDGDSVIDSTAQNPAHIYPAAGAYNCTLTVTDAISTDTTTVNLGIGIIPLPGFGSTFSSATLTRGYWFQTPVRFSIISLQVPDESNHGLQNVAVYRLAGAPPAYSGTASGGLEFFQAGTPSNQTIPCAVSFDANEFVGILGACGDATTMRNSYATPAGPYASSIFGQPVTLTRFLTQTNIVVANGTGAYSNEAAGALARVSVGISACVSLNYGTGTPSGAPGAAAPVLRTTALPFLGATAQLTVDNQDTNALGILAIGLGRATTPTPYGTVLVNAIGGTFLMNGAVLMNPGTYNHPFAVPNNPVLNGTGPYNWQNVNLLPFSNQVSMSNGNEWYLAL